MALLIAGIAVLVRVTLRERLNFYRRVGTWQFSGHDWSASPGIRNRVRMYSKVSTIVAAALVAGCAIKPEKPCAEFAPGNWSYVGADAALDRQFGMGGDWQPGHSDGVLCNVTAASSAPTVASANPQDAEMLLRLHEDVMNAHRQLSVDLLLRNESTDYVVAGRGKVTRPTLEERRARLDKYFKSTRFTEYVDMIPPVAMVSQDGSLGWVMVQVRARGEQEVAPGKTEPLEFESAWIELYRRGPNGWQRIGNVSNFKE